MIQLVFLLDDLSLDIFSTEKGNNVLKNPKYIETRMNELYPVKKSRLWLPSGKENSKVSPPLSILRFF